MSQHYQFEFKKKIVRLHLEEGRTLRSLAEEYNVSKASISKWVYQFCEEFAYVHYNHVRPHSYNNYRMPYEARYGIS